MGNPALGNSIHTDDILGISVIALDVNISLSCRPMGGVSGTTLCTAGRMGECLGENTKIGSFLVAEEDALTP